MPRQVAVCGVLFAFASSNSIEARRPPRLLLLQFQSTPNDYIIENESLESLLQSAFDRHNNIDITSKKPSSKLSPLLSSSGVLTHVLSINMLLFTKLFTATVICLSSVSTLAMPTTLETTNLAERRDGGLLACNKCSGLLFGQQNANLVTCGPVNVDNKVKRVCFCAVYTPIKSNIVDHFGEQCEPSKYSATTVFICIPRLIGLRRDDR